MYDTEQNEQNRRREQSLYRAAFAGVHASESLKREDFYMKHNKPARVRVGRLAFTCMPRFTDIVRDAAAFCKPRFCIQKQKRVSLYIFSIDRAQPEIYNLV